MLTQFSFFRMKLARSWQRTLCSWREAAMDDFTTGVIQTTAVISINTMLPLRDLVARRRRTRAAFVEPRRAIVTERLPMRLQVEVITESACAIACMHYAR